MIIYIITIIKIQVFKIIKNKNSNFLIKIKFKMQILIKKKQKNIITINFYIIIKHKKERYNKLWLMECVVSFILFRI